MIGELPCHLAGATAALGGRRPRTAPCGDGWAWPTRWEGRGGQTWCRLPAPWAQIPTSMPWNGLIKVFSTYLVAWLISHQPTVLFSHNKPATSNQPAVLFSQNKPAPAISHQPTEQAVSMGMRILLICHISPH
jgi:hypothetical protein